MTETQKGVRAAKPLAKGDVAGIYQGRLITRVRDSSHGCVTSSQGCVTHHKGACIVCDVFCICVSLHVSRVGQHCVHRIWQYI